jgi:hypothetical protein
MAASDTVYSIAHTNTLIFVHVFLGHPGKGKGRKKPIKRVHRKHPRVQVKSGSPPVNILPLDTRPIDSLILGRDHF